MGFQRLFLMNDKKNTLKIAIKKDAFLMMSEVSYKSEKRNESDFYFLFSVSHAFCMAFRQPSNAVRLWSSLHLGSNTRLTLQRFFNSS